MKLFPFSSEQSLCGSNKPHIDTITATNPNTLPTACRLAWYALWRRLSLACIAHHHIMDLASLRGDSLQLYRAIGIFLVVVIVLLGFELVTYFKGWSFRRPGPNDVLGMLAIVYVVWVDVRARYLLLLLQSLANLCTVLFIVQTVDKVVHHSRSSFYNL